MADFSVATQVQGPNLALQIQNGNALRQMRTQSELRDVLSNPESLGPDGQPTGNALKRIMGIDPNIGIQLQQNGLRTQGMQADLTAKKAQLLKETVSEPAAQLWEQQIKAGINPAVVQQNVQKLYAENLDSALQSGPFSDEEKARIPRNFDYARVSAGLLSYDKWRQLEEQRRREAQTERHQGAQEQLERERIAATRENREDAAWSIVQTDKGPKRYNIRTKEMTELDGKPVQGDAPTVTGKMGTAGTGGAAADMAAIKTQIMTEPEWKGKSPGEVALEALRRKRVAQSGQGSLTDDPLAMAYAAEYFKRTGTMPFGMNAAADRTAVIKFLAHEGETPPAGTPPPPTGQPVPGAAPDATPPAVGPTPPTTAQRVGQAIGGAAEQKADAGSLRRLVLQRDSVSGYERGAEKAFDLALSLIPKSAEPLNSQLLTGWVRAGEKQFGDVPNAQFYTALVTALDEYAKVISGGTGSAAASTDSARRQALSIIPPGATTAQIKGIIETIKKEMENRRAGYDEQIKETQARLRGGSPASTSPSSPPSGAPAGPRGDLTIPPAESDIAWLRTHPDTAELFDKHFGAGAAKRILSPASAPQGTPPGPRSASRQEGPPPSAPTSEGGQQRSWALPPARAKDPDGTTYNGGRYVKQGDRVIEAAKAPVAGADEQTSLERARAAIKAGAARPDVEKMLRDAGIDPGKL